MLDGLVCLKSRRSGPADMLALLEPAVTRPAVLVDLAAACAVRSSALSRFDLLTRLLGIKIV